jgi:hypothetical protein
MPFQPPQTPSPLDPQRVLASGVGLQKGLTKEQLKQRQAEEQQALQEEKIYRQGVANIKDLVAPESDRKTSKYPAAHSS